MAPSEPCPDTVLVVEDDPKARMEAVRIVEENSYYAVVASSAEAAARLSELCGRRVVLLWQDLGLPPAKKLPNSDYLNPSEGFRSAAICRQIMGSYRTLPPVVAVSKLPAEFLVPTLRRHFKGWIPKQDMAAGFKVNLREMLEEMREGKYVLGPSMVRPALDFVAVAADPEEWKRDWKRHGADDETVAALWDACNRQSVKVLPPRPRRLLDQVLRATIDQLDRCMRAVDAATTVINLEKRRETEIYYCAKQYFTLDEMARFCGVKRNTIKTQYNNLRDKVRNETGFPDDERLTPAALVDIVRRCSGVREGEANVFPRMREWLRSRNAASPDGRRRAA